MRNAEWPMPNAEWRTPLAFSVAAMTSAVVGTSGLLVFGEGVSF